MAASYEVLNRTRSGKAKVRYNGIGTTGYRDLDAGETVSQQSYAAAVGNEASDYERDDDTQQFTGRTVDEDKLREQNDERDDDSDDDDTTTEDNFTPFLYRNLIYGGLVYSDTDTEIQLTVWVINQEPDSTISFGDLRENWWGRAKGIAYDFIGPIAEDIEIRGTEGASGPATKKIDPDELRQADKPLGKVHGTVMVQKGGSTYEYTVDFSNSALESGSVSVPPSTGGGSL